MAFNERAEFYSLLKEKRIGAVRLKWEKLRPSEMCNHDSQRGRLQGSDIRHPLPPRRRDGSSRLCPTNFRQKRKD